MTLSLKQSIELYKKVGHRNTYLFEWLYDIYSKTSMPGINKKYHDSLALTKTKLTIFDVLVDDIADNVNMRNKTFLKELITIPWIETKAVMQKDYYEVTKQIWDDCINTIKKYPRFQEFGEFFYFDLKQVLNSMEYSNLINTYNYFNNIIENDYYGHHGVMVLLHGMMDLMCSPKFDRRELGKVREILYFAQKNARIGNMLNTYLRELVEKDLSSPILTYAIEKEHIDPFDGNEKTLLKLKGMENIFKNEAENNFKEIEKFVGDIKSLDVKKFVNDRKYIHHKFITRIQYWKK